VVGAVVEDRGAAETANAVVVAVDDVLRHLAARGRDADRAAGGLAVHGVAGHHDIAAGTDAVVAVVVDDVALERRRGVRAQARVADECGPAPGVVVDVDAGLIAGRLVPLHQGRPWAFQVDADAAVVVRPAVAQAGDRRRDVDTRPAVVAGRQVVHDGLGRIVLDADAVLGV